jgi:protein-tyrosine-phosphatase
MFGRGGMVWTKRGIAVKRVMFVCMGNICRSPLAEALFTHVVRENNAAGRYVADSSGTIGYHAGERSDPRMRQVALKHGVTIDHSAQKLNRKHLGTFDLILCMDQDNLKDARALARTPEEQQKIMLFRTYDPMGSGNVPDPYYGGIEGFENVFSICERTARALFTSLEADT